MCLSAALEHHACEAFRDILQHVGQICRKVAVKKVFVELSGTDYICINYGATLSTPEGTEKCSYCIIFHYFSLLSLR